MPLRGSAFLALWNDFDPARDAEYNCWHTFEHVPERVGIAGILSGRRYMAAERSDHRYFTLYELASLASLDGPEYEDVAQHPTPWSQSMRTSFRNFFRQPCETVSSIGTGTAAAIATFRFSIPASVSGAQWRPALQPLLESDGISALHLGRVDATAKFPVQNAARDEAAGGLPLVLLVEGIDRPQLDAVGPAIAATVQSASGSDAVPTWETYALAFAIARDELPWPTDRRRPPRNDLRARFTG
jgi:hypothetical protein